MTDIETISLNVLHELFVNGNLGYLDSVCDPSYRTHDALTGDGDVDSLKRDVWNYRAAFSDMRISILGSCSSGNVASVLWTITGTHKQPFMGLPPTGRKYTVRGINFDRYRNGKLVESYIQWDALGFLQELALIPRLEAMPQPGVEPQPSI